MRKPLTVRAAVATVLVALAPGAAPAADPVVVSAAASLKNAFEDLAALHAAAPGGSRPAFNFGASGDLVAQIRGGAPVDVFAAAAAKDMDGLEAEGVLLPGTRVDFAANTIVLIVPATGGPALSGFAALAQPGVGRVAIASPKTSPAGRYAEEVFASAGIAAAVRPRIVTAETVRQVLDYVARGEVDAGVVYATDAVTRSREVKVVASAVTGSHQPVVYPIAVLKGSARAEAARAFVTAVRSEAGQAILARHGFAPVPGAR
jgi:molybdate transport system substrate-binding protein